MEAIEEASHFCQKGVSPGLQSARSSYVPFGVCRPGFLHKGKSMIVLGASVQEPEGEEANQTAFQQVVQEQFARLRCTG